MNKELKKKVSQFKLIGTAHFTNYTFAINETSKKNKSYIYNRMSLNLYCGEQYGEIPLVMFGGYDQDNNSKLYVHGITEDGKDDYKNLFSIDWADRFNQEELNKVGDRSFITVDLGEEQKFLSPYDAIKYLNDHLNDNDNLIISGNLKYSLRNNKTEVSFEVNYIKKISEIKNYKTEFTQTILLNKDSATQNTIDMEKNVLYVDAKVLDYVKGYKETDFKGTVPMDYRFEFNLDKDNMQKTSKQIDLMFKVKKEITEITVVGEIACGGNVITMTYEMLPNDIKEFVDTGLLTEEEACAKYTDGKKDMRFIIKKPYITKVKEDDKEVIKIDKTERCYKDEDLIIDLSTFSKPNQTITVDNQKIDLDALFNPEADSNDFINSLFKGEGE